MVKWIAMCVRLVSVIFCIVLSGVCSHPDIYRVRPKDGGRVIQPYSCRDPATKEEGVCMFSWNCQRSNGTHLTYCMDRFYFGSCCRLPPGVYIATPPPESSNEVTETEDSLKLKVRPSTHRTTTEPTSQRWSTESSTQTKKGSSSTRLTPKPTKASTTEFPPGLVTWRPSDGTRSTRIPVKVKPTKLFSTKPLFASSTTEAKTTEPPLSSSTSDVIIEVYTSTSSKIFTPQSTSLANNSSTSKSTTQRLQSSVTSVSKRRTRPTRPYGSTYPKRKTRPTRPYHNSNTTLSKMTQRKTRPTRPIARPTTPVSTAEREATTSRPSIGTWSNILERTTKPFSLKRTTAASLTRKTTPSTTTKVTTPSTSRATTPSSTTRVTPLFAATRTSTTPDPIPLSSTTSRPTMRSTVKRRRPTRPHTVSTLSPSLAPKTTQTPTTHRTTTTTTRRPTPSTTRRTTPSTTRRTTPSTTRRTTPATTRRTTQTPSTVEIIEIITFPPFPGATRKPSTGRPSTTTVSETRRTTTLRPRPTTSTTEAPYTSSSSTTTSSATTESPSTTEKIIPSHDYTKDSTVDQTSTSDVILLAAHQGDELASPSTLNPDLELTTEQREDTTEQWFTTTSGIKSENIGRNPIVPHRPVQVLYDEHGNEIVNQEHFEEAPVSKFGNTNSPTSPMTRTPTTTTSEDLSSTKEATFTEFDITPTVSSSEFSDASNKTELLDNTTDMDTSTQTVEKSQETSTISEQTVSLEQDWSEKSSIFTTEGRTTVTVPEFLLNYTYSHISNTDNTGSTKFTTNSFISDNTEKISTDKTTDFKISSTSSTENTEFINPSISDFDEISDATYNTKSTTAQTEDNSYLISKITHKTDSTTFHIEDGSNVISDTTHTTDLTASHTEDNSDVNSDLSYKTKQTTSHKEDIHKSTSIYGMNVPVLTTTAATSHNAEATDATIHGDHWMDDLYDYYDYYLDSFYDHHIHISESKLNNSTEAPIETINNHKITFSPIGNFDALVQEKNQPSGNSHASSETVYTESTYETSVSPNLSTTVFLEDNSKTSPPTIPIEVKTHSKATPGPIHKRPQKPFLPTIPEGRPSIKKPSKPPATATSTEHAKTSTTTDSISENIEITTYQPHSDLIVDGIKTTIVTIDNHRPPVHETDITSHSISPNPIYKPVTDIGDKTETEEKIITESTFDSDKFSIYDMIKDSSEEVKQNTSNAAITISIDDLNNDVKDSTWETSTSIPTIRYPFPTILMKHTTKRPVITESLITFQTQFDTDASDLTFKQPTTHFLPEVTATLHTTSVEDISKFTPEDISSNEITFTETDKIHVEEVSSASSIFDQSTETSQQTESTSVSKAEEMTTFAETVLSTTNTPEVTVTTTPITTTTDITFTSTEIDLASADYKEVCGKPIPGPMGRIVDGGNSYFGEWPWVVSLRQWKANSFKHKCGATLLNEFWAITAAHCVENVPLTDILLRMGEYDITHENEPLPFVERRVQIIASHPQFDRRTFEYDLALLRFYEPVVFQRNILPACVPTGNDTYVGRHATVTGWGRLYEDGPLPDVIQEVSLPIITNKQCENMYKQAGFVEDIPDIFICAGYVNGGKDSCEGDSGGPMVLQEPDGRWVLAGVISWGIGCAMPNQPGVYTRITKFSEWINQIIIF